MNPKLRDVTGESPWYETIFEQSEDSICVCDTAGLIVCANRAFGALIDEVTDRVLGLKADTLLSQLPFYRQLDVEPDSNDGQCTEFCVGQPERVFRESHFSSGDGYEVFVIREITEQKRLQEQLKRVATLATLGELIGGITHELNNPLATVIGYAQLLESDDELPARVQRGLHHIHQEAQRASGIVTSLRAFAGRTAVEKARLNLNELLNALGQMKVSQLSDDHIQLNEDYDEALPAIWGDAPQLQQAFLNIINNAAQALRGYTAADPAYERTLQIVTRGISEGATGNSVIRVDFNDNGPGIADENLNRVLEPYFTTKPLGQGTGLGLSMAAGIVAEHGGQIRVESTSGAGARFIVELPVIPSPEAIPSLEAIPATIGHEAVIGERQGPTNESVPGAHLLVVGETPVSVAAIVAALANTYQVTTCCGGAEATAALAGGDYDLIVATVEAPRGAEPSFFEYLQGIPADLLPHLLLIADEDLSPSIGEFLHESSIPVLTAPVNMAELQALVARVLGETR